MSKFTEIYKSMNGADKLRFKEITDNPIMAYMKGFTESDIRKALQQDNWSEKEIIEMMVMAERAKNRTS